MSLISDESGLMPLAAIFGNTEITATGSLSETGRAAVAGKTAFAAAGGILLRSAALIAGVTTIGATPRLNDDPNWFGAGVIAGATALQATGSISFAPFAAFAGQTTFEASATVQEAESATLSLIVDIIPPVAANANYQQYDGWLKIGGVTVPIVSYSLDAPDDSFGMNLSATIARFSMRGLFVAGAAVEFLVSEFGVWTSVLTGKLSAKNYSIQNKGGAPSDVFSFTSVSTLNDRVSRSPAADLLIYDPAKVEVSADDYEPRSDSAGRLFNLELAPVSSLSLYKLLMNVFVGRCGFSNVKTNLPDYALKRADFSVSGTMLAGVAPHVGMFEPLSFAENDTLWIVDATNALPNGFPSPRTLTAERLDGITGNQTIERIDGFELQFVETDPGDFFTTRTTTPPPVTVGSFGEPDYTRTDTVKTIREYRERSAAQRIISEVPISEVVSTYDANLDLINRVTQTYSYDRFGRQKEAIKIIEKLTPDLPDNGENAIFQLVRLERQTNGYSAHPFINGKQIQSRYEMRVSGLIAIDAENKYFGRDFPQDFIKAEEAGNLRAGMTLVSGAIETVSETSRPLRNGQVDTRAQTVNFVPTVVGKAPVVRDSSQEPRIGDISLKGNSGKQNSIYVFPTDNWVRTTDPIVSFAVGELPPVYALPLARRQLIRRRTKSGKITASIIGFDLTVRRGAIYEIRERESNTVARMIVEGFSISGSADKTSMILRGREL